jgi:hypothetical protein
MSDFEPKGNVVAGIVNDPMTSDAPTKCDLFGRAVVHLSVVSGPPSP